MGTPSDGLLLWLAIGLGAGIVARLAMAGRDPGGFAVPILLGIAGALLAGLLFRAGGLAAPGSVASIAGAASGAIALLLLYRLVLLRRG